MALNSPQAVLPKVNPLKKGMVLPSAPVVTGGAGAADAYNKAGNPPLQELFLQNGNNQAVKVAINREASANDFDFVLKAGTGTDTGDGGERSIDISLGVFRVSLYAGAAMRVHRLMVVTPNGFNAGRV